MSKKKLIYIVPTIRTGGAEVAFLSAITTLNNAFDFRGIVLSRPDESNYNLLSDIEKSNLIFNRYSRILLPIFYFRIIFMLIKSKPDIIISSLWRPTLIGLVIKLFNSKAKLIFLMHSTTFFHFFDKLISILGIKYSNYVFADSMAGKQFVEKIYPKKEIAVLSYLLRKHEGNKKEFGKNPKRFVYVGRLNKVKNIRKAIDLIGLLNSSGIDVSFHIYGPDDGEKGFLADYIKSKQATQYIEILPAIPPSQVGEILKEYEFFLQLSLNEGMAMSVVEAMMNRLVCFISPVGEIPRYSDDGVSAVFLNNDHPLDTLLFKMKDILYSPGKCQLISENARMVFIDQPLFSESLINALKLVEKD